MGETYMWKELGVSKERAKELQEEFDAAKNNYAMNELIHHYGLTGEDAFISYLIGSVSYTLLTLLTLRSVQLLLVVSPLKKKSVNIFRVG